MNINKIYLLYAISSCLVVNYSYSSNALSTTDTSHILYSDGRSTTDTSPDNNPRIRSKIFEIASAARIAITKSDVDTIQARLFLRHGPRPTLLQQTDVIPITLDYLAALS